MTRPWLRHAVAAALVVAASAAGVVLLTTPASAAACPGASGVTVVVDPHGLGGGVLAICDGNGGGVKASTLFTRNGVDLTYVQRQPGFVCRVDGAPASDPCVNTPPADAYWGLFWSDGTTGTWSYATAGAAALTIPDGGYVAFSWQGSTAKALPGVTPTAHASTSPSPSASPSGGHSSGGGNGGGSGSADPTSSPATPSATPSTTGDASASPTAGAKPRKHPSKHASADGAVVAPTPSPSASADAPVTDAAAEPTAARTGGLPGWVVPVVLVLLAGSAGGVAFVRRTRGAPPP